MSAESTGPEQPGVDVPEDANTGRPCRIMWLDSGLNVHLGWAKRAAHMVPVSTVESVGIWLGEADEMVFLASSRDRENDNWMGSQTIWRPSVQSIEWLDGQP